MDTTTINTTLPPSLRVRCVPNLSDNYCWYLIDDTKHEGWLVDPAETSAVLPVVEEELNNSSTKLRGVLTTHKHWDHIGANEDIAKAFPDVHINGPRECPPEACITHHVAGGDFLRFGNGLCIRVLDTSCHTAGHVSYLVTVEDDKQETDGAPLLFCGDTLFVGGCGRFFEGDAKAMYKTLYGEKGLGSVPDNTLVYCGHEYTVKNLMFARSVDPNNTKLQEKLVWSQQTIANGKPTVPSMMGEEREYNPFLRVHHGSLAKAVGVTENESHHSTDVKDHIEVMKRIRALKDSF